MNNAPNDGIIITGAVSGQVANRTTGNVTQTQNTVAAGAASDDVLSRLAALEQLLAEHREQIPAYNGAKRDVADLRDEVARPDKDTDRIGDTLRRLTARVGTVTVLASAADKLAEAVRTLF